MIVAAVATPAVSWALTGALIVAVLFVAWVWSNREEKP